MTPKEQRELKEATAAISPSAQLSSSAPVQQSPMPAKSTASTGSRISFVGHSPSFNNWVFNVGGRDIVATNYSSPSPLRLSFKGYWDKPTFTPIKTSGFDITDSTATNVVFTWGGNQYVSAWKAVYDDEDPEGVVNLWFGPPVPYTGPARSPVGDEVKTTPPVQGGGDTQTRQTPSGGGIYPTRPGWDSLQPIVPPTPTPTPAPEPAKGDLLSLAIKLGSVYMLLK